MRVGSPLGFSSVRIYFLFSYCFICPVLFNCWVGLGRLDERSESLSSLAESGGCLVQMFGGLNFDGVLETNKETN